MKMNKIMKSSIWLSRRKLIIIFSMMCISTSLMAQISIGTKKVNMNINGHNLKIPYFSNKSIDIIDSGITNAVIVIHGTNRNADDYYVNMSTAASMRPLQTDSLIIVAPQFLTEDDIDDFSLDNQHLYWSNGGWKSGSNSKNNGRNGNNSRPARISSYAVLDTITLRLAHNFPNLKSIVITGHSAGGQVTNRYSATTPIVDTLCDQFNISTKFIVANPSSYLYLDEKRRDLATVNQFSVPVTTCNDYNDWKYGLDNLYTYPANVGTNFIRANFKKRQVVYLLGQNDNDSNSSSLDVSCEAMLQGDHRLERGTTYYNYLIDYYGNSILNYHSIDTIPGVGHSNLGMYTSTRGLYHLFESYPNLCNNIVLSLPEERDSTFSFYPNPTSGLITISSQLTDASVLFYNTFGKIVKKIEHINGSSQQININDLSDGTYIIEFRETDRNFKSRIIKFSH